ncbi:MAG: L-2-hydroxyglutarate oxidase [Planctomycetota bacterium]
MPRYDLIIIGGGIVGLATAYRFCKARPNLRVAVLEKEAALAAHQTGRNSGVIHSGIYYRPGSLKARHCLEGKQQLEAFCQEHDVPFETCGKVIVALEDSEIPALEEIHRRGIANGVPNEVIDVKRLRELEPHAAGVRALHVPSTGIVDYRAVTERMAEIIRATGNDVFTNNKVVEIRPDSEGVTVATIAGEYSASQVVNCAGLHSDRVARMSGLQPAARIVPFRGEYFCLHDEARHLVKNLIYPVPDPEFPFLGVHFTRMIDGEVECGPNAVLAFAREGYKKTAIDWSDLADSLSYSGFLRLAARHWRMGAGEMWRSVSKAAFVRALQRLVPDIREEHLSPAPAGVRAQAVQPDGALIDDFLIEPAVDGGAVNARTSRVINVLNAPSPAATASLKIGETIAQEVLERVS